VDQQVREQDFKICNAEPIYTSTGIFRAYRKRVLDSLEIESDGKEIHLEILSKALALGYRVKESPAILTSRKKGKSKFKFRKTAISHLVFSVFEKPVIIFGFVGLLTLAIGFLIGIYIVYLRLLGDLTPGRPLITFAILLILGGFRYFLLGLSRYKLSHFGERFYAFRRKTGIRKYLKDMNNGKGQGQDAR